ncbi:MAG: hypothetical protein Q4B35_00095 [Slackia sp.]|nr:hypothetical protein [Slackia sp.]
MEAKRNRLFVSAAIVAVVLAGAAGSWWITSSRDAWLVKSLIDRVAPWEQTEICYAKAPASTAYFDTYADATGAYENYVYEIDAVDASGAHRRVVLVSFGTMLENEGFIAMTVRATSAHAWEYIDDGSLPELARRQLC